MTPLTPAQADLAAEHLHVAEWAAKQAGWRWPRADRDDLLSWAYTGLMEAAQMYDPDHGMTFIGFARRVIRFAIIDAWRADTGGHDAHGRGGRRLRHEFTFDHTALDDRSIPMDPGIVRAACSVDLGFDAVENATYAAACIETLALSERERYVLVEVGSGTSLQEIGAALGVSESRVSQIRKKVYDRLPANAQVRRCAFCSKVFVRRPGTRQEYCDAQCRRASQHRKEKVSA